MKNTLSGRKGRPPTIIFAWIVRPMNALQLVLVHQSRHFSTPPQGG